MYPADATGCEYPDSGPVGSEQGGSDRGGPRSTGGQNPPDVTQAHLYHVIRGGETVKVGRIETDTENAVQQCHRRRNGAAGADGLFDGVCSFQVSGMRKAVGDDGRLEGHDRCTCVQRLGNLVAEPDRSIGF